MRNIHRVWPERSDADRGAGGAAETDLRRGRVLIFGACRGPLHAMAAPMLCAGYVVHETPSLHEAIDFLESSPCRAVFVEARTVFDWGGADAIRRLRDVERHAALIVVGATGVERQAIRGLDGVECVEMPANPVQLVERARERATIESAWVAVDARTRALFETVSRVAAVDSTVLITGESGTGKDVLARQIYQQSARRQGPFVPVNCGALPEALVESELFGYKKGSFTGANVDTKGLVQEAHGGVLFLDEIGEMPKPAQVTLLRFLDSGETRRVGESAVRRVDVRVIAATNRPLEDDVRGGRFRHDLFYRLKVLSLDVPPLRQRTADIPALIDRHLERCGSRLRLPARAFSDSAMSMLRKYPWPGNIRELQNVVEGAAVAAGGEIISEDELPPSVRWGVRGAAAELESPRRHEKPDLGRITSAIERSGGNQTHAAAALGISRTTLRRHLRRARLDALV